VSYSGNVLIAGNTPFRVVARKEIRPGSRRGTGLAIPVLLMGIALPSSLQLLLMGAKLTPTRIGLILLIAPSLARLLGRERRLLLSDFLAFITAIGMVAAAGYAAGLQSAVSAIAECLDFIGGYFVARAFVFDPASLNGFVRLLKAFAAFAICIALGDVLTGHWIARDAVAMIIPQPAIPLADDPSIADSVRGGLHRATSTFDHPILFGVFCSMAGAILLYSERTRLKQLCWAGFCFFGGLLSLSSAAAMAMAIVALGYAYDRTMRRYTWRWNLLWTGFGFLLITVIVGANNPLSWIISHATLDPQTGFYRILIWDAASAQIWQAPFTGAGFATFGYYLLDRTVDSVWLVTALHYGVPVCVLLVALNLSTFLPAPRRGPSEIQRAFTIICLVFMLTGLTVHFWNYMWTFWGVCIGIRASLREWPKLGAENEQY
jgi:hypothetical protein